MPVLLLSYSEANAQNIVTINIDPPEDDAFIEGIPVIVLIHVPVTYNLSQGIFYEVDYDSVHESVLSANYTGEVYYFEYLGKVLLELRRKKLAAPTVVRAI
jgi:hypothetical protein